MTTGVSSVSSECDESTLDARGKDPFLSRESETHVCVCLHWWSSQKRRRLRPSLQKTNGTPTKPGVSRLPSARLESLSRTDSDVGQCFEIARDTHQHVGPVVNLKKDASHPFSIFFSSFFFFFLSIGAPTCAALVSDDEWLCELKALATHPRERVHLFLLRREITRVRRR